MTSPDYVAKSLKPRFSSPNLLIAINYIVVTGKKLRRSQSGVLMHTAFFFAHRRRNSQQLIFIFLFFYFFLDFMEVWLVVLIRACL